ncbi:alpha-aminoadipic semialdehyde synthase, mitochondrial [Tetranychus urticae]|nr:alpha-aminoadipic semialdehyde synthase, mitochondrial [Tetranychus urticae]
MLFSLIKADKRLFSSPIGPKSVLKMVKSNFSSNLNGLKRLSHLNSLKRFYSNGLDESSNARILAIRREDASIWERRAPLAPFHVRKLVRKGVKVVVQPSNRRAYPLQAYVNAGAQVLEDISDAPVVIGVKQPQIDNILPNKTYCFFSHTHKAQEDNMPLLDIVLERNVRLIDYERMVDAKGNRVVAFGRYAGIAGMINTFHGLGLRLLALGHHTPFMHVGPAHNYRNSGMARQAVRDCGYEIALGMMPRSIGPLTFVFTGSGNVSQGAQEIFRELPYEYVDPKDLAQVSQMGTTNKVYASVVSRDNHLCRKDGGPFDSKEYDEYPERYYSNFATKIAPYASVIVNGIYYAPNSPRLLTIPDAKRLLHPVSSPWLPCSQGSPALPHRLIAICDISADPGGSIEFMTECTTIDTPFCLYDADYNKHSESFSGPGVLVCSIDNMPTQIPLESTEAFGDVLFPYIFDIIRSDANKDLEQENFNPVVKTAVIASNGKLAPSYEYIMDLRMARGVQKKMDATKSVLVLGAGYVSKPLVEYLTRDENIHVTIASELHGPGEDLASKSKNVSSVVLDIVKRSDTLAELINQSELVVSLLPYSLHPLVAKQCIESGKNMVTASYVSPEMESLHEHAKKAGITIMNEVGLDPGIDHLLAMECFNQVTSNGGRIKSFVSYCGGLPAPEAAENPLKYKFSWNPRGVLLNSLSGALWEEFGQIKEIKPGGDLMSAALKLDFLSGFNLEGYPNRDSTIYKKLYGINSADTILRGSLRYQGYCDTMIGLQKLGLFDSRAHPSLHPRGPDITWRQFMCHLFAQKEDILITNLKNLILERLGSQTRLDSIEKLGFLEDEPIDKKGSPLDTVTHLLATKLAFGPDERDVIIMRHNIGIEWPNGELENRYINLVVYGEPNGPSAMARCVGYPAAIASKMILEGEIQKKGIVLPLVPEIYNPMLKRLRTEGIFAIERSEKI